MRWIKTDDYSHYEQDGHTFFWQGDEIMVARPDGETDYIPLNRPIAPYASYAVIKYLKPPKKGVCHKCKKEFVYTGQCPYYCPECEEIKNRPKPEKPTYFCSTCGIELKRKSQFCASCRKDYLRKYNTEYVRKQRGSVVFENCIVCGKPLERAGQKYCTTKCGGLARKGPTYKKTCSVCGNEFETHRHNQHICGGKDGPCFKKHHNVLMTTWQNKKEEKTYTHCSDCGKPLTEKYFQYCDDCKYGPHMRKCVICGEEFEKIKDALTCGKECQKEYRRIWENERYWRRKNGM